MSADDPIVAELRKAAIYSPDASDDEIWNEYRDRTFVARTRPERQAAIRWMDDLLDGERNVTKSVAKIFQRRRELVEADLELWRANR